MIDEDEGEQHAAAGEIRPMLSIKQVLALIPFSRATLYREIEAGRFPAAHEIAPRRIAWFKDEVASWQLATKKVARDFLPPAFPERFPEQEAIR
jgi:prophage regulatory protein